MVCCFISGCDRKVVARGWCKNHYERWRVHGDAAFPVRERCMEGSRTVVQGYWVLTGQKGHPLAGKNGALAEHRMVLYAKLGPDPQNCHWCGCGPLGWRGSPGSIIHVDHVDRDKLNNDPENLVPACIRCNTSRHQNLLTVDDVQAVRELYVAGKLTQAALGEIFGVSPMTISRVVNRPLWLVKGGDAHEETAG